MSRVSEIMETMEYGPSVEDSSAVRDWLAAKGEFGHFIGGKFTAPGAGFDTRDPATGDVLAQISQGSADDVAAAVRAARKAQRGWAKLSGSDRARYLYAIARHIQKRERFLSVLETLDNGKPIRESRDADIPLVARHFYHHAGWAELLDTQFPGHVPLGVCGQIIPWNFPLLMLAWKIAPALAAGNTVVLKPAEYTSLTALAFAEICQEVGLPAGVVNIVTGDGETGAALVSAKVDKIAFTGSTEVGRKIAETLAGTGRKLTLELGGKSPFIVMEDADLDAAVEGVVDSIWFNQGQVCCAGSRILVAENVADRFEGLLQARMEKLRLGPPLDKSTDIGAIVDPVQKDRIISICRAATDAGAELVGGNAAQGCFIAPGYLRRIQPANPGMQQEIFGPIATLSTFRTADEAIELANNTRYGLAGSVWSESATVATDLAARIRAGVIWINGANMFDAAAPFGGYRESGFGREGGRVGMLEYLAEPKVKAVREAEAKAPIVAPGSDPMDGIDRTAKLYIGGAQKRPDGGGSYRVPGGLAPLGNRKDIRNAVEAAGKATKWAAMGGHARAQVLYYIAENLSARAEEFAARTSRTETDAAIARAFHYAAWADKFDGANVQARSGTLVNVIPEAYGVMGIACPNAQPLAAFMSLVMPAIAMGNSVVAIAAQDDPLPVTDLYQVFDTSDLPGGVVNIVIGSKDELSQVLAAHDAVSAMWYVGSQTGLTQVERSAGGNLKPVWSPENRDWTKSDAQGEIFLRHAVHVKTVWLPYGALPAGSAGAAY
ncbi:aldehyde dehydrogenase family protein [Paracoccus fistulariae]|uniref:Aldehyde dehydrogenase family protein n=1 Tax=Paracoccus fistulariae TaxID=658446 RepID=A0ABY7SIP6_9RHOB|nr:aldehyde dehydrogenase family protein [Paracoccus fistulariae]MDB6181990.1 aldehyde dehydrogenase family protein [Paracoccus fistulariae]WCR06774.1 aldehyde dehydrogenase family protein [Paracoccus fistulariae]